MLPRRVRRLLRPRFAVAALLAAAPLLAPGKAHAEPSAWLAVGGGYALQRNGVSSSNDGAGALSVSLGVGTSSVHPFVVGGIARSVTYFGLGTDLGLALRLATGGFARGDWGLALDAGVAGRFWSQQQYGHFPVQVVLTGGMPFGFQVGVGTELADVTGDSPTARGGFAVLELDFLRLTVNRSGATTSYWPNPSAADAAPAGAPTSP